MGNRRLEHHRSRINTASPIVSKVVVVETWKQHIGVEVTQSLDVGITTTRVETVVVSNKDVVKRGILIRFIRKLGSESSGVLTVRNLNRNSTLPIATIGVVGMVQMVFTNPIKTIHVNKIAKSTTDQLNGC